jgi:Flp pilus assembly protein CpaB
MRSTASRHASSPLKAVALVTMALLVGVAATAGGLWVAGVDLPFLKHGPDTRGMVAVPISARLVPAYTRVSRDYLIAPETGLLKYSYLPPKVAEQLGVITNSEKIFGRVLNHDKPADYAFKEEDFLPKGTREGLVAAIPAGKRAMTVEVTKIQGIHALRTGDRLDMIASQSIDLQKVLTQPKGLGGGMSGAGAFQVGIMAQQKRANVRVLVQNGMLVAPVTTRLVPISQNTLTQGAITRTKPVQEAVIAVDPEEIAPLSEALAVEATITCVARSGHPDDPGQASVTPSGDSPSDQVAAVERIVGGTREVVFIPKGRGGPMMDALGMVAVPLCGKPIAAGAKITPEHLLDPATNRPHTVHLRPGDVRRLGLVIDATRIVGRVLGRRKNPDTAFKEEDFQPQGDASPLSATAASPTQASGAGTDPFRTARRTQ